MYGKASIQYNLQRQNMEEKKTLSFKFSLDSEFHLACD